MEEISIYHVQTAGLAIVMLLGLVWDLKERRIPNWLTVGGLAVALVIAAYPGPDTLASGATNPGALTFTAGLLGAALALVLTLPLFALGGFGGGDAKLLIAAGGFLGPRALLSACVLVAVFGGLLAIITAVRGRLILRALANSRDLLLWAVTLGRSGEKRTLETEGAITIPYGVAVAAGALSVWFYPAMNFI